MNILSLVMYSIYFADTAGCLAIFDSSYLEVINVYKYNTKLIIPYDKINKYDIGDVLIGKNFIICITYDDIKLIESGYLWGDYLYSICDLLNWDNSKKVKIYTNNNSLLFPHTSISTINSCLKNLLSKLNRKFILLEIC